MLRNVFVSRYTVNYRAHEIGPKRFEAFEKRAPGLTINYSDNMLAGH